MKRVFVVYGKKHAEACNVVFEKEWVDLRDTIAELNTQFEAVGVFRPKCSVKVEWVTKDDKSQLLLIGQTAYTALQVMKGEAAEHVETLWSTWDE